ncbi:MAG: hypothetical protein O2955_00570 [Planctomycetota bacterium]|nr:hypothetical protein [Planctomycetota bacterium]MDA1210974.1 hypothetical protein [Planctomycetota bacterium]
MTAQRHPFQQRSRLSLEFRSLRRWISCLGLLCAFILTGCTSFERDWRASEQFVNPCDGFSGRWEGSWKSDVNGHHGKLRALISPTDNDRIYNARFKATYAFIIPYQFEIPMTVTTDDQGVHFEGQADLGWLAGGNYTYNGIAHGGQFDSVYCASKDNGIFTMSKVDACCSHDDPYPIDELPTEDASTEIAAPLAPQE